MDENEREKQIAFILDLVEKERKIEDKKLKEILDKNFSITEQ